MFKFNFFIENIEIIPTIIIGIIGIILVSFYFKNSSNKNNNINIDQTAIWDGENKSNINKNKDNNIKIKQKSIGGKNSSVIK